MTITESLKPHQKASEYPTTQQLQAMHPVNEQALAGVENNRQRLSRVHDNPGADFIVAMGECGVVSGLNAKRIRRREGHRLRRLSEASGALVMSG